MADGSNKPIKDVKIGDKVAATDPATGITTGRSVTKTWRNLDRDLTTLTLKVDVRRADGTVGSTTTTLETTHGHPVWNKTAGTWVNAGQLVPGHLLLGAPATVVTVAEVVNRDTAGDVMLDLTVDTDHTYYVMAAENPVLVHNCGTGTAPNGASCACNGSTNPSTPDLIQAIATRAEARIGGTGAVAGTKKHAYAATLLDRYQGIYGSRGLQVEQAYLNGVPVPGKPSGSAIPDVFDPSTGIIYDYKFVIKPPGIKQQQIDLNATHVPGAYLTIEVNP
jgi:hypothetical protein